MMVTDLWMWTPVDGWICFGAKFNQQWSLTRANIMMTCNYIWWGKIKEGGWRDIYVPGSSHSRGKLYYYKISQNPLPVKPTQGTSDTEITVRFDMKAEISELETLACHWLENGAKVMPFSAKGNCLAAITTLGIQTYSVVRVWFCTLLQKLCVRFLNRYLEL